MVQYVFLKVITFFDHLIISSILVLSWMHSEKATFYYSSPTALIFHLV